MSGELFSKLRNKWYQFVWDYLVNNKSSILLKECSKELLEVHNNLIKEGDGRMIEKRDLTVKELYGLLEPLLDEYGDLEVVVSYDGGLVVTSIKNKLPMLELSLMRKYSRIKFEGY